MEFDDHNAHIENIHVQDQNAFVLLVQQSLDAGNVVGLYYEYNLWETTSANYSKQWTFFPIFKRKSLTSVSKQSFMCYKTAPNVDRV